MRFFLTSILFNIIFFLPVLGFSNEIESNSIKKGRKKNGFYSQYGQDKYLFEHFFKNKKNGIFVDIGAYDGVLLSNTNFFEELGWNGICVEPIPEIYESLKDNRNCICIQGCIAKTEGIRKFLRISGEPEMLSGFIDEYDPQHLKRIQREVANRTFGKEPEILDIRCYLLNNLLEEHGIFHVDYLSIDTEGSELEILQSIDFEKFQIDIIDVENNYNNKKDRLVKSFLLKKGYKFIVKIQTDDIYIRKDSEYLSLSQ